MKHTIQSVKKIFENEGYVLLTEEYQNAHQHMQYICPAGHRGKMRFCTFYNQKCRCKICRNKNIKITLEEAKSSFAKENCVLLSENIPNNRTPLNYICSCGNQSFIRWYEFKRGRRCKKCQYKRSLDHIFPIKAFVDYQIFDVRLINSLENLQPMLLKENQKKSGSYSKKDFENWLKEKGYEI